MSNHLTPTARIVAKKLWLLAMLIAFCAGCPAWAQDEVITSARALGGGNIFGLDRSSTAVFENPGSLNPNALDVGILQANYLNGESRFWAASIAVPFFEDMNLGAGLTWAQVPNVPMTDVDMNGEFTQTGDMTYESMMIRAVGSKRVGEGLSIGASVNYLKRAFGSYTGAGWSLDVGAVYVEPAFTIAATLKNGLAKLIYTDGAEELIAKQGILSGGFALPFWRDVSLLAQATFMSQIAPAKAVGLEYVPPFENKWLTLRAGWRELWVINHFTTALSLGVSLKLREIAVHYAMQPSEYFSQGLQHYISVNLTFDTDRPPVVTQGGASPATELSMVPAANRVLN